MMLTRTRSRALTARRLGLWLAAGLSLCLAAVAFAVGVGMPELSLCAAIDHPDSWQAQALWQLQIPRIALGLAVGATLALGGAVLQGLLRNPLADPFILGVSGGAAVGSAVVTLAGSALGLGAVAGTIGHVGGGFAGALGALILVTLLATERGRLSPLKMLLVGVIVNALAGAALMVLAAVADPGAMQITLVRLMGSVGIDPTQPALVPIVIGALLISLIVALRHARGMNLLALGDETAHTLGVRPDRLRLTLFIAISLPIGAAVAVSGLIGFVGLIVPHLMRLIVGPDHRLLLPLSALVGGAFVVVADACVSAIAPIMGTELPVGVVTALVGGPVFLVLLRAGGSQSGGPSR